MFYPKYERITAAYPFHLSVGGIQQYTQITQTIVEPKPNKIDILFLHEVKQYTMLNGPSQERRNI